MWLMDLVTILALTAWSLYSIWPPSGRVDMLTSHSSQATLWPHCDLFLKHSSPSFCLENSYLSSTTLLKYEAFPDFYKQCLLCIPSLEHFPFILQLFIHMPVVPTRQNFSILKLQCLAGTCRRSSMHIC